MKRFGPITRAIAIATLMCFAAPQAEAIEAYGAGAASTQLDDGLIVQVRGGRGGGTHRGAAACIAVVECIAGAACIMERIAAASTEAATRTGETSTAQIVTAIATSTET